MGATKLGRPVRTERDLGTRSYKRIRYNKNYLNNCLMYLYIALYSTEVTSVNNNIEQLSTEQNVWSLFSNCLIESGLAYTAGHLGKYFCIMRVFQLWSQREREPLHQNSLHCSALKTIYLMWA